jgi:hypothetical protein
VTADLAPYRCNAAEARDLTEQIKSSVEKTWRLLLNAHEWNAWGALGYSTWESYVRAEFGIGRSRSYQLLDQARVVREIEAAVSTTVDITERDVRDLKPHLAEVTEAVRDAVADVPEAERPAAAAQAVKDARARLTTTTRTTEATKLEQDVDLGTGEIDPQTSPPSTGAPTEGGGEPEPSPPLNPLAAARAEVAKQPAMLAAKAVQRLHTARLLLAEAGDAAAIVADLANDGLADGDQGHDWLPELDAALPLLNDLAAALRRRNLRSVR